MEPANKYNYLVNSKLIGVFWNNATKSEVVVG